MREIKFRAWDIDKKEMFYSDFIVYANGRIGWWVSEVGYEEMILVEKKVEIMQYTGLKDKNGKEIYEDDLVKNNDYIWRIIFKEGAYYIDNLKDGGKWIILGEEQYCEVIGNIYENPELLNPHTT